MYFVHEGCFGLAAEVPKRVQSSGADIGSHNIKEAQL